MERDIDLCKTLNLLEIVTGVLTDKRIIDTKLTKRLASRVYPMAVTFHKAVNHSHDILDKLERLSRIKEVSSILTSGGKKTALKYQSTLRNIIDRYGSKFNIIVAGSIIDKNFDEVQKLIDVKEYHGKTPFWVKPLKYLR